MAEKSVSKGNKFAVVKIGGGQELVREGDLLEVTRLGGEAGTKVRLRDVLLTAVAGKLEIGTPFVAGAEVGLEILEHAKGPKIEIRRFRAKSRHRRKVGHRQPITKVRVEEIGFSKGSKGSESSKGSKGSNKKGR